MHGLMAWVLIPGLLIAANPPAVDRISVEPSRAIAPAIRDLLQQTCLRVTIGEQQLDFWFRTEQPFRAKADLRNGYSSLELGALIGVFQNSKPWTDFRGQEIPAGTYTLRYAKQPASKDHEDTSPSSDFLILCPIAEDRSEKVLPFPALKKLSEKASGGTHPAVMVLLPTKALKQGISQPKESWRALRWDWITKAGELPMAMVVEGVWNGK